MDSVSHIRAMVKVQGWWWMITHRVADELGVSLTPVREGIQRLAKEGLVVLRPHRGATVATPTRKDLLDLYEVRAALERLATAHAADRLTRADFRDLRRTLRVPRKGSRRQLVPEAWIAADQEFHEMIVRQCGNPLLINMIDSLQDRIRLHRQMYFAQGEHIEQSLLEHRRVVEAMERGDATAAAEAMFRHLTSYLRSEQSP